MGTTGFKVSSITITTNTLEDVLKGEGSPVGLIAVLELLKDAVESKTPIYIEDKRTGMTYQLREGRLSTA